MAGELETRVLRKITLRIVPFIMLLYFVAFIDRVNVGFAALTMNKDIGLSASAYGFGAGIFFWGYFLFEVPSNLALDKFGARIWIARVMITWGLVSGAMAFVQGPMSFYVLRFLLGASMERRENGFLKNSGPARDGAEVVLLDVPPSSLALKPWICAVLPSFSYQPRRPWLSGMSGFTAIVELENMLRLRPPKSLTLTPLNASTGLASPAIVFSKFSACCPHSVRRTLVLLLSISVSSRFLTGRCVDLDTISDTSV